MKNLIKYALVSAFVSGSFLSAEVMKVDDLKGIATKVMNTFNACKSCKDKADDFKDIEFKDSRLVCYKDGKVESASDKSLVGKDASDFKTSDGKIILEIAKAKLADAKGMVVFDITNSEGKKRNIVAFMMDGMVYTVGAAAE